MKHTFTPATETVATFIECDKVVISARISEKHFSHKQKKSLASLLGGFNQAELRAKLVNLLTAPDITTNSKLIEDAKRFAVAYLENTFKAKQAYLNKDTHDLVIQISKRNGNPECHTFIRKKLAEAA
ncbi:hypothetical protein MTBPR1_140028 [Candidatus Terasakiella magnetica]|uniref:Uncharacterized protein n=1 Tax=Candidatus Terasakiella magnetica TaxID=1867952 RepID=A0A1C3RF54_9PROT|nr:hypothetical protein [Candidatus Terasakiella magnetica]SCA55910.1 hypothetical protein MTBPR1_140028 [Candidatus Terasakiella magnetica]